MNSPDPVRRNLFLLPVGFLLLTLALGAAGYRYYVGQKQYIEQEARRQLSAIADLKVQQVVAWRRERLADARVIAATPAMPVVQQVLARAGGSDAREQVRSWMETLRTAGGYANVILVDSHGEMCLSAGRAGGAESQYAALAKMVLRTGDIFFSDLHFDEGLRGPHLGLNVPLRFVFNGPPAGALLLGIDPNEFLYPLIQSWPTSSPTAETLLVRREGDEVVYINELRHQKGTALRLRFPLTETRRPSVMAALGREGIADGIDYRGIPVLAAVRRVPDSHWALVAKVDASEIRVPVRRQALWLAALMLSLILAAAAGGGWVWHDLRSRFYRQRYEAERDRRALLGHYDYLSRFANDIILLTDEADRIVEANDRAVSAYGYQREELIGMPLRALRDPASVDSFDAQWATLATQDRLLFETRHRRRDGTTFPVELSARRIAVEGGVFRQSIIRDITERKQAEHALRDSRHFVERILETTPNLLYIYDLTEQRYRYANREIAEFLGYTPEALAGMGTSSLPSLLHPEDAPRVAEHHARLAKADFNQVFEIEYRLQRANGQWLWLHSRDVLFAKTPEGAGVQILGAAQDITEYRSLEQQLLHAQKMEAVGRLAGGVAHDFNNLLTVILGFSELALAQVGPADPMREALAQISESGQRAAALTRQLLAFSRKQVLQPQVVDLSALVVGIKKMLERLIGEDVELVTALDPALRPVKVDPAQYEQIIVNLAVNARDAMPHGGRLTIETANVELDPSYAHKRIGVQPGSYVMTAISDSGIGMDEATQSRIFEPFFTTKPSGKGTGLGLSIVYGIVKQSGGEIWLYSEPGKGTTFKIYLPPTAGAVDEAAGELELDAPGTGTVLVVEDEEPVRSLIRRSLEGAGYEVLEAASADEALRVSQARAGTIDLMITDVIMPGRSGRELAKALESARPGMRVLYISGYTDTIIQHGVLEEGIAFLAKPFTPRSLVRKVRAVLEDRPAE
jgi:two-component system, cell cycle sensor histidine kinase and response regulator CckA